MPDRKHEDDETPSAYQFGFDAGYGRRRTNRSRSGSHGFQTFKQTSGPRKQARLHGGYVVIDAESYADAISKLQDRIEDDNDDISALLTDLFGEMRVMAQGAVHEESYAGTTEN
jgi:hypothetical protein